MADPFDKAKKADEAKAGLRISLSGKTANSSEAGIINISGTVEEVAEFLKLDPKSEVFVRSPFAAIVGTWNAGHHWAQGDYAAKGKQARSGKAEG
ncbi:hypothetical protein ACFWY9_28725 [Amycolatopsis sp. NPDC059027]|uniref:hypothetical protein n=1 Tax=Amycolatopsis sp. NPDC059027 TaxID=3346709 RepID=UPI00366B31B7